MIKKGCNCETLVSSTIQAGRCDQQILDHVNSCLPCADLVQIIQCTRALAIDRDWPLPDPDLLWIKSAFLNAEMPRKRDLRLSYVIDGAYALLLSATATILFVKFDLANWIGKLLSLVLPGTEVLSTLSVPAAALLITLGFVLAESAQD
jgi:hypothetical protein